MSRIIFFREQLKVSFLLQFNFKKFLSFLLTDRKEYVIIFVSVYKSGKGAVCRDSSLSVYADIF